MLKKRRAGWGWVEWSSEREPVAEAAERRWRSEEASDAAMFTFNSSPLGLEELRACHQRMIEGNGEGKPNFIVSRFSSKAG